MRQKVQGGPRADRRILLLYSDVRRSNILWPGLFLIVACLDGSSEAIEGQTDILVDSYVEFDQIGK